MSRPPAVALARARIPLTVIGGFLGAGKTTLLNRILSDANGLRIAVLVNDFGSVNIDAALVSSRSADAISLANGCVCCQIGDDLTDALIGVMERQQPPDWIVIEASGVSDPRRIAQVGLSDPMLTLDGVIVLVDSGCIRDQARDPRLRDGIERQLKAADLLVLNKIDGLTRTEREALKVWLRTQAGDVPMFEARYSDVPLPALSGVALSAGRDFGALHCHHTGCDCGDDGPSHGLQFDTWLLDAPDAVYSAASLRSRLGAMPPGVLRLKGIVRTDRYEAAELQFAGRRASLRNFPGQAAGGPVVAIGLRGTLPKAALAALFTQCRIAEASGMTERRALALSNALTRV